MGAKLRAWARAVKARHRAGHPVLWLFTDGCRVPDPLPAIAALPRGAGVVFRHDDQGGEQGGGQGGRRALAIEIAAICRRRGLALTIAGDPGLAWAVGAGRHLRGRERAARPHLPCTIAVHNPAELRRAARVPGALAFLSPVFATRSHPGARPLGVRRFAAWTRGQAIPVLALGGIDDASVRRLPRGCAGVGAIGAFGPRG